MSEFEALEQELLRVRVDNVRWDVERKQRLESIAEEQRLIIEEANEITREPAVVEGEAEEFVGLDEDNEHDTWAEGEVAE